MAKNRKKHPWFRRRGYPHFDFPIGYKEASRIVKNPKVVSSHSFFPFIHFHLETFKVRRDADSDKLKRVSKKRPIAYASHVDCHIYSYYAHMLSRLYEHEIQARGLHHCILAFRPLGKSNINFAFDAFELIRSVGDCSVLALDIKSFFDNLDHATLKQRWSTLLGRRQLPDDHYAVFKSITRYASVNLETLYELLEISINNRESAPKRLCSAEVFRSKVRASGLVHQYEEKRGIPQGSPISALLSNVYMLEFDSTMQAFVMDCGGHYLRYCDDILLIVPTAKKAEAEHAAITEIKRLLLDINDGKTDRVDFVTVNGKTSASKVLQYLGFLFDGERVLLRSASLARYSERMKRGVRLAKATMKKRNIARENRGEAGKEIFKKKLYRKYSYLGRRNFVSYGYSAAKQMGSSAIRAQLRPLWKRLQAEIVNE